MKTDWGELEYWPEDYSKNDDILFYVEFQKWNDSDEWTWRLFKRNWICSKEEWGKQQGLEEDEFMSREFHPYNLGDGVINLNENAQDLNTKSFLKFLVDSLNKNIKS